MSREAHVRFWEGVGVRFPCATRLSGGLRKASATLGTRSAIISIFTMAAVHIRALTGARPIKPTSPRCHSAWQPNLGRRSTYQRGESVQTIGTTSITRRAKGVSIKTTMEELAPYMRGWRGYFGYCETPEVLIALTRWVRLRLRAAL